MVLNINPELTSFVNFKSYMKIAPANEILLQIDVINY